MDLAHNAPHRTDRRLNVLTLLFLFCLVLAVLCFHSLQADAAGAPAAPPPPSAVPVAGLVSR